MNFKSVESLPDPIFEKGSRNEKYLESIYIFNFYK